MKPVLLFRFDWTVMHYVKHLIEVCVCVCAKNWLVSRAWWYLPLTWLTNHRPLVLWWCWLGRLTRKINPKMTYNVSSGTLHPTIPYHTCPHVILETIADICFLSGIYIDWGKFSDEFGCQDHRSRSRSFFGRFKVTWYCYERSEIPSPMALFFFSFWCSCLHKLWDMHHIT